MSVLHAAWLSTCCALTALARAPTGYTGCTGRAPRSCCANFETPLSSESRHRCSTSFKRQPASFILTLGHRSNICIVASNRYCSNADLAVSSARINCSTVSSAGSSTDSGTYRAIRAIAKAAASAMGAMPPSPTRTAVCQTSSLPPPCGIAVVASFPPAVPQAYQSDKA
jgi:hypothetical protein